MQAQQNRQEATGNENEIHFQLFAGLAAEDFWDTLAVKPGTGCYDIHLNYLDLIWRDKREDGLLGLLAKRAATQKAMLITVHKQKDL